MRSAACKKPVSLIHSGVIRMPRRRKPVSLMVAEGNPSELSRAEMAERRAREPRPTCLDPSPPDWLPDRLVPEFEEIAAKLKGVAPDFFTELDEDCLGRYLVAREQYVSASELYERARDGGDVDDMAKCARMQDIAFKQCRMKRQRPGPVDHEPM